MPLTRVGYWLPRPEDTPFHGLIWPGTVVDEDWDPEERALIINHLKNSTTHTRWMGYSGCRFCGKLNGTRCFTDGKYIFPEGYAHYLEEHGVKPPAEFIEHVRNFPPEVLAELILHRKTNEELWATWEDRIKNHTGCPVKGTGCSDDDRDTPYCLVRWESGSSSGGPRCQHHRDTYWGLLKEEDNRHKAALRQLGEQFDLDFTGIYRF